MIYQELSDAQSIIICNKRVITDMHELMDAVTPIQHETEIKLSEFYKRSYHIETVIRSCTPPKYNLKCKQWFTRTK